MKMLDDTMGSVVESAVPPFKVFPHPGNFGAGNLAVGRPQVADTPENNSETDLFATPLPWYAVRVHGRREERFADQMRQADVACFLPMIDATKRVRRREQGRRHEYRNEKYRVPFIQGYVFIAADVRGIYAAKATGIVYAIIPPAIQAKLVAVMREIRTEVSKPQEPARLMMGRAYEIKGGALMGKRGLLIRQHGDRCVLEGDFLLGSRSGEFDVDMLEPV